MCVLLKYVLQHVWSSYRPLSYVIRTKIEVTPEKGTDPDTTYDPCLADKAYGASGSILQDFINNTSQTHPLFIQDNARLF